jgi:hypothetical protein
MAIGHSLEDVSEEGIRLDVIEFGGSDELGDDRPAATTSVGSCEEVVLPAESNGPNGTLDRVVIELDATVIKEAAKRVSAGKKPSASAWRTNRRIHAWSTRASRNE